MLSIGCKRRGTYPCAILGIVALCTLPALAEPQLPDRRVERREDPPAAAAWRTAPTAIVQTRSFTSVQVNVDAFGNNIVGDAANEPSIAVDPTNPLRMVIGWRQFDSTASNFRQAGYGYTTNGGRNWKAGKLDVGVFRSDPVLRADAAGRVFFYSLTQDQVSGAFSCQLFRTLDGGKTWTGPQSAFGGDKAWTAFDRTGGIGNGNFYAAWDNSGCCGTNEFSRSTDAGGTFMSPVAITSAPQWGTVTVGRDGAVYVCGNNNGTLSQFVVAKSSNAQNGAVTPTWDFATAVNLGGPQVYFTNAAPNPAGLLGQVWIGADTSNGPFGGNLYVLCSVNPAGTDPLDVMFISSSDGGAHWTAPVKVNDEAPGTNAYQWFGTMAVAPNGRIDVIWNDTTGTGSASISGLRYSSSNDAGATWAPSVAVSPTFNSMAGFPNQNKIGDYYDMNSDLVGANVAYAATFTGGQDVYYVRIGDYDCNGNGVGDAIDISTGAATDFNANGIPDSCEGLGDMNCDGKVNGDDIGPFVLAVLEPASYTTAYPACFINHGDINGDANVNEGDVGPFADLLNAQP